jgi:hypothetical protein
MSILLPGCATGHLQIHGERMTARFAGHAVVVDGATDAARRMAYLIGVAVDL